MFTIQMFTLVAGFTKGYATSNKDCRQALVFAVIFNFCTDILLCL